MPEYRFIASDLQSRPVQGILVAGSRRAAQRQAAEMARKRHLIISALQPKLKFLYRVRRAREKPVQGEQAAFSAEEIRRAFRRMGYEVLSVQRKLIQHSAKPPVKDVVMFIRLSADLLREKLSYDEVLQLLGNDIANKNLKRIIAEIRSDLKAGRDGPFVFRKQACALGRFASFMLGLASQSGNMAEIYDSTAKFMEREQEFKKSLRSALIMPAVTVFALIATVLYYIGYIFPQITDLFVRYKMDIPPLTAATMQASDFIQSNMLLILAGFILIAFGIAQFFITEKGRVIRDRYLIRFPLIGPLIHKTSIEIFCRVFYALYSGSSDNIEVIRTAAEACRNRYMERRIKEIAIPMMLRDGKGLVESLQATGVFTDNTLHRLRSGAESGTLRNSAFQVAQYYEKETTYKLQAIIDWVQVGISIFITVVLVALTIISSETALMRPKLPGVR